MHRVAFWICDLTCRTVWQTTSCAQRIAMDADAGKCPVQKQKNTSQNVLVAKTWGNFPQNKVVPSFRKRLREYLKAGRKCLTVCCISKMCSHLRCLRLSWTLLYNFDICATDQLTMSSSKRSVPLQLTHRLKSFTSCSFSSRLAAPDFVLKMYWGQGWSVARNLEVHTGLLHYCTFGLEAVNDAQYVRVDRACGKDNDQQNLSKMIMWNCRLLYVAYNQIASSRYR